MRLPGPGPLQLAVPDEGKGQHSNVITNSYSERIIIYIKTGRDTGVRLNRHLTAPSGAAQQERVSLRYEAPTSREQVVGSSPPEQNIAYAIFKN